jgi:solute carrier family 25 (mitochondrial dicarboxylate transporter), member 10
MTYSVCRFWAYDQSKKMLGAGPNSPPWKLAAAGVMAGSIAGVVGNPGGEGCCILKSFTLK